MPLLSFLDLSTGHLTERDVEILNDSSLPVDHMAYEYGWIVSMAPLLGPDPVDESLGRFRNLGLSEPFLRAASKAAAHGCWLLRFDADADLDPDLPIGGYGMDEECDAGAEAARPGV